MNFKKMLLTSVLASSVLVGLAACPKKAPGTKVTLWVSEVDGVAALTKQQVEAFAKAEGVNLDVTVEGITEADSATKMLTDVEAGADIYCFAQDQFARLVQGGALSKLGKAAGEEVTANNNAGTVAAAKSGDDLYAYPLTSDNGYFMYYDKSVITNEEHLTDVAALVADCEAAGKNFSMEFETSGWYLASWFFSVDKDGKRLCDSEWTTDSEGKFTAVRDTFNSDNGVIAAKGARQLVKSKNFISSSETSSLQADTPSAILISGTWAYNDIQKILGDDMGVAELPYFTVDGQKYHMGSYSGCKLMGVKPTEDAERSALLHKIARYLTGEKCQEERYDSFSWGPSNNVVAASEKVQENPALVALSKQNQYAVPQGQIHGSWWDISKVLGAEIEAATDDEGIKAALKKYADTLDATLNMSDDVKDAFTVIGSFYGDTWTVDVPMQLDVTSNVWKSKLPIAMTDKDEFKVRKGLSWDEAYGTDGENFKVTEAGTYFVTLDMSAEKPVVALVPATKDGGEAFATNTWSVIGAFGGHNWDYDEVLEEPAEGSKVIVSKDIEFAENDQFKVRFGADWAYSYGLERGGDNVKITAAGTYKVSFNRLTGDLTVTPAN